MKQAHTTTASEKGSFADLVKNAVYGVCLDVEEPVFATHRELVILRQCSEMLASRPSRRLHIVGYRRIRHAHYIAKTLQHFGVSTGQIDFVSANDCMIKPRGFWLFVANQ